MNGLLTEIHNFGLFLEAIFICAGLTGLAVVPFVLIGYEMATKRRA